MKKLKFKPSTMDKNKVKSVIESLLFQAGEPLSVTRLARLIDVSEKEIEAALVELGDDFERMTRGLAILRQGKNVQMVSAPGNGVFVRKLVSEEMEGNLSRVAMETLAIVAYRGPIARPQIEEIRGVNCSHILRVLMMRGLIEKIRQKNGGRLARYQATMEVLKHLGLASGEDLPRFEELSKALNFNQETKSEDESESVKTVKNSAE